MMSQTAVVLGLALGVPSVVTISSAQDEKVYQIVDTTVVKVSGIDSLTIRLGQAPSLVVSEARDRYDTISVDSSEKQLRIRATNKSWFSSRKYRAVLTMTDLTNLSLAGSVDADVTGVSTDAFALDVAGSVDLVIGGLCQTLNLDAAGSVDIDASGLMCADVSIDAAGATDILVHASKSLDIDAAGSNDILYTGNPSQISTDLAGAGSVEPAPQKQNAGHRGL